MKPSNHIILFKKIKIQKYLLHFLDKLHLTKGFKIFLTTDLFDSSVTVWPWSGMVSQEHHQPGGHC